MYNSLNQKKTNILFRADSSSNIGIGHIMRDLVLAKQYPDASITFATLPLKGNINNKILDAGHNVVHLLSNNKKELVSLIKELQIDLLIIDHYDINYEIEKYIKEKTEVKIFILDDTYEKHYCDILLNHNIGANEKKYKTLIPKSCELRCGGNYTLLRDEFYKEKYRKYKKNNNITKIFIAMGGTDSANLNVKILKILKLFENLQVNLITTSSNKNLKDLRNYIKNKKWIKLHVDSKSIAKLMKKSNFAILTPSVSVNEAYFMNLPFIAIKTAKNQEYLCKYLKKKKYMVIDKFKKNKLAQFIQMILVSKNSKIALIEGV
ncbi:UDP-2,4-diacetamido-2,4,6-trideoxy-beta-L-altropyranose hydrolase [Sulfurimonas sp.]|uniref:UDP-2,4-diacetamido-2,4, 6-trideoxy-beta-L-altropyranose hydrolase n=1 Tax=Sulfurimonas sp. TaxID=2022749 RepID=UPI0039E4FD5B